jgi:hypothetical protein
MSTSQLSDDLSLLSDTAAARVLNSTSAFPEHCDDAPIKFMREMAHICIHFSECPTEGSDATVKELMTFWSMCKEKTSFTYSGRDYEHYKAASHSMTLSLQHVESINLAICYGTPLQRGAEGSDGATSNRPQDKFYWQVIHHEPPRDKF